MYQLRPYIESLVGRGGPAENERPEFDATLTSLATDTARGLISRDNLAEMRTWFGEALSPATLQGRLLTRPHGRAGDHEILDHIYTGYITSDLRFANWDRFFQAHAAAHAIRRRKAYFQKLLDRHHARRPQLRVLKIAAGTGRAVAEWLSAHPDARTRVDCIDSDPRAIRHATALNEPFLDRVTFRRDEPLLFQNSHEEYDLIWAVGLFEHLDDALCVRMLRRLFPALTRGGELVVGNFSTANPSRAYLELIGDRHLRHRDRPQLYTLAANATLPYSYISAVEEPEGINLFLHLGR